MDISIFSEKEKQPTDSALKKALGKNYELWKKLEDYTILKYSNAVKEWAFPGAKYGWSFRIKDRKRVIIYLLPRDGYFKAAFNFGQKAYEEILASDVADEIKKELESARAYAEGRGIRIDVKRHAAIKDIQKLIVIKLSN
ncbi:MAG TPA: DUF3788 family protein [Ignavibacteria bacterium]|nr:DUF3788 family protein [Ignavibacteria bacterium]